jgi:hypothetical protein
MIRQHGGIFGRNPTFNDVEVQGDLTVDGSTASSGSIAVSDGTVTLGVNNTKTVPAVLYKNTGDNPSPFNNVTTNVPLTISSPMTANYPSFGEQGFPGNVMMQVLDSTNGLSNFQVLDNGDLGCNNIAMTGYLAPMDMYTSNKVWINTEPTASLDGGPVLSVLIPSSGDAGNWISVSDPDTSTDLITVNQTGYASFNFGLNATVVTVNGTVTSGTQSLATNSTAQDTTLQLPSTYASVKYLIQARSNAGARFQITEIVATRNATTTVVSATPVDTNTGGVVATYAIDISGGNWRLKITPSLSSISRFTVHYTAMP